MADYASSEVTIQYGASSSLQDPDIEKVLSAAPVEPVEFMHRKVTGTSAGVTIALSTFTAIEELYVQNNGTVVVSLVFQTVAASATHTMDIKAGQWVKLADIDPAVSLTLNSSTTDCSCDVIAIGT